MTNCIRRRFDTVRIGRSVFAILLMISVDFYPPARAADGLVLEQTTAQIRIVVDLTPEGRRLPSPDKAHPVICFPVFSEPATVAPGVPAKQAVVAWLARALAENGYQFVSPQHDQPTQLLVFQWGEMNPQVDEMETRPDVGGAPLAQTFWNRADMIELIAGDSFQSPAPWWKKEQLFRDAVESRYYFRIKAYDYVAAKKKEQILLWHARMSAPSDGLMMQDVIAKLLEAGGPNFGRGTKHPITVQQRLLKRPRVELGETELKEYLPAAPPSAKGSK